MNTTYAYRLDCGCIGLGERGLATSDRLFCPLHGSQRCAGFGILWAAILREQGFNTPGRTLMTVL